MVRFVLVMLVPEHGRGAGSTEHNSDVDREVVTLEIRVENFVERAGPVCITAVHGSGDVSARRAVAHGPLKRQALARDVSGESERFAKALGLEQHVLSIGRHGWRT